MQAFLKFDMAAKWKTDDNWPDPSEISLVIV